MVDHMLMNEGVAIVSYMMLKLCISQYYEENHKNDHGNDCVNGVLNCSCNDDGCVDYLYPNYLLLLLLPSSACRPVLEQPRLALLLQ